MLFIGADHRGFSLKEGLKKYLLEQKIPFTDLGNSKLEENDDYPPIAASVAQQVGASKKNYGLLICGNGVGVSIVANKFKNVRAGLVWTTAVAKTAKADDDINIICLPADYITLKDAQKVVIAWLRTSFKNETKYKRRLSQIAQIEKI